MTITKWYYAGGGRFEYGPQRAFWINQELGAAYTQWEQYAELLARSRFSPLVEHLDDVIGGSAIRTRLDLQTFTLGTISRALSAHESNITLKDAIVTDRVAGLRSLCEHDELDSELLLLLDKVALDNHYVLDSQTDVRLLDSDKMTSFISSGAVPVRFEPSRNPAITIQPAQWVALVHTKRERKITSRVVRGSNSSLSTDVLARSVFERFANALTIVTGIRPRFLAWRSQLGNDVLHTGWSSGRGGDSFDGTVATSIPSDNRTTNAWTSIELSQNEPSIMLAVHRLGFAANRERQDDRLLDVMIALEALILKDQQGDRNELRFRAALRCAHWWTPGDLGLKPGQVYDLIRRAYDYRSTLSHGNAVNETKLVSIRGDSYTYDRVVAATEAVARTLLEKALKLVLNEKLYRVPWDSMLGDHLDQLK